MHTNRVAINKAVTVQSVNGAAVTVIQGNRVIGNSAVRCAYLTNNAALIGFTLVNGATRSTGVSKEQSGGGALCESSNAVISACIISNNIAQASGGGVLGGTLNNCLVVANSAASGGAVATDAWSAALNNCTVVGNSASVGGGGFANSGSFGAPVYLFARNSIIMNNTAPTGSNYTASVTLDYCCTAPMPPVGAGNFTNPPIFANPGAGDFRLQTNCLCINAGNNSFQTNIADLAGHQRVVGSFVDLGAYEYQSSAPVPLIPTIQAAYTGFSTGVVVTLSGQIAGHPNASRWDFADGTIVSNQLPTVTHTWKAPGDYVISLRGYNDSYPNGVTAMLTIHVLEQPVHYVAQNSTNPLAPYLTWNTAATTIQDAVDAAYIRGTVIVSNGLYATGGAMITSIYSGFSLSNRVTMLKPITLRSLNGPAVTTIQGYQVPGTTNGNTAARCVYAGSNSALAGFTLIGGATRIYNGQGLDYEKVQSGGGVYGETGAAIVSNCVMTGNAAYIGGGAASGGTLVNCLLTGNSAEQGGGAFHSALLNCIISSNTVLEGGALAMCTATNCLLTGCSAVYDGGGAHYCTLNNCTVTGNSALEAGGGTYGCTLNNCIVYNNTAPEGTNYSPGAFGDGSLQYCCTTPLATGPGNFTGPPAFIDEAGGNLRLQSNSPCINSGNNSYVASTTDLDGRPRIVSSTVDVGAYEYQGPGMGEFIAWLRQHGLAADGSADFADPDSDWMNNWQEWRTATDPTDRLSCLRLLNPLADGSGITVSWQSSVGVKYFLQRSTNLSTQPFSVIESEISGRLGATSYTDTTAQTNGGPYFYRVGVR